MLKYRQPPARLDLKDLIMVAGHAIYLDYEKQEPSNEDGWILEPFQKGQVFIILCQHYFYHYFFINKNDVRIILLHFYSNICIHNQYLDIDKLQVKIFLKHIERGVRLAQSNTESLLIFSG